MKPVARYALAAVFCSAALAGGGLKLLSARKVPELPENIICTAEGDKILNADGTLSSIKEANLGKALAMASQGEIGFGYGGATIYEAGKGGDSRTALFILIGDGYICYNNDNGNCSTMKDLLPEQKKKLTATLCDRAGVLKVKEFQRMFCAPKP